MISVKKNKVIKAFIKFDNNEIPNGYSKPKRYWVRNPKNGKLYPQKTIYGIAKGLAHKDCDSATNSRKALKNAGFEIFDEKEENNAHKALNDSIIKSAAENSKERQKRLLVAHRVPTLELVHVRRYNRNPDVIAERLSMAEGICEDCKSSAPFNKKKDGTPFLEVHHVKPLTVGGDDTVENTLALCPNCHRKAHHG